MLTGSKTYHQYMAADNIMKKTMILLHDSIEYKWMIELLHQKMNSGLTMFANISILIFTIYFLIIISHDSVYCKGQFHLCMVKEMKKGAESCFEYIFKEFLPRIYINNNAIVSFGG